MTSFKYIDSILTKETLIKDYVELKKIKAISEKYSLSTQTIIKRFKKYNIDYKRHFHYNLNHNIFSDENEVSFYLAGFIAADGNVYENNKKQSLTIILSEKDKDFLIKLKSLLQFDGAIFFNKSNNSKRNLNWKDSHSYGFRVYSTKIVKDLKRFNIVPRKTKIYTFPDWLINHKLVNHFIRGYVDGDGCIRIKKSYKLGKLDFSIVGQPKFLTTCKDILEKNCKINNKNKIIQIRKNGLGCLQYCGNQIVIKIADFLYNNASIFLERKKNAISIQKSKLCL